MFFAYTLNIYPIIIRCKKIFVLFINVNTIKHRNGFLSTFFERNKPQADVNLTLNKQIKS